MRNLRKYLTVFMITVLSISAVGCSKEEDKKSNTESKDSKFSVGVVLGEGGANDQSFNQSALEGLEKAKKELKIKGTYLESNQDSDYVPNIETFIDEDADLIVGVGYTTANSMLNAAKLYPDKKFVIVDHNYEEEGQEIPKNMICMTFDEREAAYLVGLIASKMSESNKIGFIGGMKIPNITRFEEGFIKGVKEGKTDAECISQYANSFDDASLGKSIANQMYGNNTDIILSAAGATGLGAIEAAKEKDKYAIGVDRDQSNLAPKNVLTSALKKVNVGVYDTVKELVEGKLKGGEEKVYGLKQGGVGIVEKKDGLIPQDVLNYVNEMKEKVKNGEIKVPATKAEYEKTQG